MVNDGAGSVPAVQLGMASSNMILIDVLALQ